MDDKVFFSVVSPVFRSESSIEALVERISVTLKSISASYEIILVNDCSPDNSWSVIERICETNKHVKGLNLSRNFGQHHAITAGLDFSSGEWVFVMDCDLQDQPEEMIKLYNKAMKGFEIVLASRKKRNDPFLKVITSTVFYKTLSYLTGINADSTVANFGIYHRKVIDEIVKMKEQIRYFPTMVQWLGFKQAKIEVEHARRPEGETAYNFRKRVRLALDIILAYSDKPLRLIVKFGLLLSLSSFAFAFYVLIRYINGYITLSGYASLFISIWFFFGITIMILGIIGLYIGKTFESSKGRPLYVLRDKLNF